MDIKQLGYTITREGEVINKNGHVLRPYLSAAGYKMVKIKTKGLLIHRLVAKEYCPNPDNLFTVNHKDENKLNNHADNLEWCSKQYNCEYSSALNYVVENIKTGEQFEVFNLNKWCKEREMNSSALIATLKGTVRKQHKGYKVISRT